MGASIRESQIRLLTPDQKEMAECIGFEAYSKLAAYYGGSRVYVAKLASLELAERDSRIIREAVQLWILLRQSSLYPLD